MRKQLKSIFAVTGMVLGIVGASVGARADDPVIYSVFENSVTDEAAYKQVLPEALKITKDGGGVYIAGGFNKSVVDHGGPPVANRLVIIRFPNAATHDKWWNDGAKAWIDKNAPQARNMRVEGVDAPMAMGPSVYSVYEANVTDEAAYKQALPEIQKMIKDNGGSYIAGGFNKATVNHGSPSAGNRVVIVRFNSDADYDKYYNEAGGQAWIDKYAPQARNLKVQGIEQK
jgi:uncharacterized protein (DUF1330 family)